MLSKLVDFFWRVYSHFKTIEIKFFYHRHVYLKGKEYFRPYFKIVYAGGSLTIGEKCFFNSGCKITMMGQVVIGSNCLFGENVRIYDHNHRFASKELISKQGMSIGKVTIGNNCWIGTNAIILKGANIGNHCVIGAGCVISGDIPDNTIVNFLKM